MARELCSRRECAEKEASLETSETSDGGNVVPGTEYHASASHLFVAVCAVAELHSNFFEVQNLHCGLCSNVYNTLV